MIEVNYFRCQKEFKVKVRANEVIAVFDFFFFSSDEKESWGIHISGGKSRFSVLMIICLLSKNVEGCNFANNSFSPSFFLFFFLTEPGLMD